MVREISSRTLQMKRAEDLDFERLLLLFRDLDVTKVLVKRLAKTDGPQGQIAGLGKGYEDVPICYVPHSQVEQVIKGGIRPRFNADINYYWMNFSGAVNKAPNAKLIQYTKTHTYHCRNFWLSENIGLSIFICILALNGQVAVFYIP